MERSARGAVISSALVGGLGALVVFVWILLDGHASLLQSNPLSGFYDAQARSLLQGTWAVPAGQVGVEGIRLHGRTLIYFGPFPALLRLPIVWFTDRFDGRLTQVSMLVAFVLALLGTTSLVVRVRRLRRGMAPVSPAERIAIGAFVFLAGAGSVAVYLASHAVVYHEAELWGGALAIAAFDRLVALLEAPTVQRLAVVSALCAAALLTRISVGLGPLLGLAIVAVAIFVPRAGQHLGVSAPLRRGVWRWALPAAVVIPLLMTAAVNLAKFDSVTSVPFEKQVFTQVNPVRRAALRANGGSAFGAQFVPTTALHYLRPDALRFNSLMPWVGFPGQPTVVGGVHFDRAQPSSSLTATMPAFMVMAAIGACAVLRPSRGRRDPLRVLRPAVAGGLVASLATLAILQVAQRYLSDFLPLVVLAAAVGAVEIGAWIHDRRERPALGRSVVATLAVMGLWSVWVNVGLAELAQHELGADVTDQALADFVSLQYRVHRAVPGGPPPAVLRGDSPPTRAPTATVFVADRCAAVYWFSGSGWRALYRSPAGGQADLRVTYPEVASPGWEPILANGPTDRYQVLGVQRIAGDRVRFGLALQGATYGFSAGPSMAIVPGREYDLTAVIDPRIGEATVRVDGRRVFSLTSSFELAGRQSPRVLRRGGTPTVGRTALPFAAPRFTGRIRSRGAPDRAICADLAPG